MRCRPFALEPNVLTLREGLVGLPRVASPRLSELPRVRACVRSDTCRRRIHRLVPLTLGLVANRGVTTLAPGEFQAGDTCYEHRHPDLDGHGVRPVSCI